jgi:hypothetical protein
MPRNSRSIVAALIFISFGRISPLRTRWPLRSSAATSIGNTALGRLPHHPPTLCHGKGPVSGVFGPKGSIGEGQYYPEISHRLGLSKKRRCWISSSATAPRSAVCRRRNLMGWYRPRIAPGCGTGAVTDNYTFVQIQNTLIRLSRVASMLLAPSASQRCTPSRVVP